MTTVSFSYFEKRAEIQTIQQNEFNFWCKTQHILSLTEWMSENSIEIHDLYGAGLVEFTELLGPIGITPHATINITDLGKDMLNKYVENELSDLYDNEYKIYYITDRLILNKKIVEYKNKSHSEKRKKYIEYHVHRYGYKPAPLDDELPFEERSYIAGPFCDLTHTNQKNILDYCSWCGLFLQKKPTLMIGNDRLCYRCGKIAYEFLLENALIIKRFNQYQQNKYKRSLTNWNNAYKHHMARKSLTTRLHEILTGDKNNYSDEYISKNPKPVIFKAFKSNPSLTLILNKNCKPIKNPRQIVKRDKNKCQLCYSVFSLEVHHIQPRSKGGDNYFENLITLCKTCHDNEYWFGHFRAYKDLDSDLAHEPPDWEWELKPELLNKKVRDLISDENLFNGYKITNSD